MTETLCDSGAVKIKAGALAATFTAAQYTDAINKAEGFVSTQARYDYVTNYASVSTIGKEFLKDVTSSKAAMELINNNQSGYTSRTESQVTLDVNYSNVVDCVNLLRDDKFREFVLKGSVA
jgi:hypothetical protein